MHSNFHSKYFVFTLNNYTDEEVASIKTIVAREEATYVCFGYETAPETGTRHLQGYVEFSRRLRRSQVSNIISTRAHLERRNGTAEQADEYCKKEGRFESYGCRSISVRGKRNDLEEVRLAIVERQPKLARWDEHFAAYAKYHRAFDKYEQLRQVPRDPNRPPSVICYWGSTGTGKTRSVWENAASSEDVWVYPGEGWFDGYSGQPIALFDDFRGSCLKVQLLLQVLDRYPLQVRVKGSHVNWCPQEIYVTSNVRPDEWYNNCTMATQAALLRRFTFIHEFQ